MNAEKKAGAVKPLPILLPRSISAKLLDMPAAGKSEALSVTCYGIGELTYDVAYWGEPEDDDELLERAESKGENWAFAGITR